MARLDQPCASPSLVWPDARPRNKDASRLPPYRASHRRRYHPYPRAMPTPSTAPADDVVQEPVDGGVEHKEPAREPQLAIVTPPRRAAACQERPDIDVEPYEDKALAAIDDASDGQTVAHPVGRSKLAVALTKRVAVMSRRYAALVEAVRRFLETGGGPKRK
ncbi:hypothetical protein FKP32DRAFT_1671944 [Trametes sanguinea]|nr:hypothetical protein FKP32DRAFT_1671944 [Trametes sanguinea]